MAIRSRTSEPLTDRQVCLLAHIWSIGGICDSAGLCGPDVIALMARRLAVICDGRVVLVGAGPCELPEQGLTDRPWAA